MQGCCANCSGGSESEGDTYREPILEELRGRRNFQQVRCVAAVDVRLEADVAVFNHVGIFAPALAVIRTQDGMRSDTIFETGAVLHSELKDAASIQRRNATEVEGSFNQADILQAQCEWASRFFERRIGESDQLEDWAGGEIRLPAGGWF